MLRIHLSCWITNIRWGEQKYFLTKFKTSTYFKILADLTGMSETTGDPSSSAFYLHLRKTKVY